jgi:hypothetical protein
MECVDRATVRGRTISQPRWGKTKGDRLEIVLIAVSLSGIADAHRFLTSFWSKSMSFSAYLVP